MKNNSFFLHGMAIAAGMLAFTACTNLNEDTLLEKSEVTATTTTDSEEENVAVEGHTLSISASIGNGTQTRMASSETDTGIKLTWETSDKLYLLTSTDGTTWNETYYTFNASEISTDNAAQAIFVCDDFSFPEGTTKVKFVYTTATVSSSTDLASTAQSLGSQSGTVADIAKYMYLETEALDATTEEAVKELTVSLVHTNAIMKVALAKGDVEWGNSFAPQELTMKLESSTATLAGTTDNTITVSNTSAAWDSNEHVVANVVVCMSGEIGEKDRWIFTTKDGYGNSLVQATSSAKLLAGGKRYNAPITFKTDDYFPLLADYFSIDATGWNVTITIASFTESTKTIITENYGLSGWKYTTPLDLSAYTYLVLKLSDYKSGARLNLYPNNSISNGLNRTDISENQTVVNLDTALIGTESNDKFVADENGALLGKKLYTVALWTYGGESNKIIIDRIYLTNTDPSASGDGNTQVTVPEIEDSGESAF